MSTWQPTIAPTRSAATTERRVKLVVDNRHLARIERAQETHRLEMAEARIGGLDAQEVAVARCALEALHVEHRVIGHRQSIEPEHPEHRRSRRNEHRRLERHRDERWPAVKR